MLREPMLQKPFHGWRINQEIQKSTAIGTLSPRLNPVLPPLPPLFFYCRRQNLPPTSHFRFANQTTKFPLSTSSLATGPSAAAAACYSGAPEPNPNSHFENPDLNVESLRESSDDAMDSGNGREDDGEGFCRRTLPEGRSLVFTCVYDDGTCEVYVVPTKHGSQELCGEEVKVVTYVRPKMVYMESFPADASTLESMKRSPKVVHKLDVHRGHELSVAFEEAMKYGGKGIPGYGLKRVVHKLDVHREHELSVAFEEAMKSEGRSIPGYRLKRVVHWLKICIGM